jgi:hypothetical protein
MPSAPGTRVSFSSLDEVMKAFAQNSLAAGAEQQHRLPLANAAALDQRVPCGHAGAGQRGGFLVGQAVRHPHQPLFRQRDVFRQHPVDRAAERGIDRREGQRPVDPALEETGHHPVTLAKAGHVLAHLDDFAGAVGYRDQPARARRHRVLVVDDQQIAEVQRPGVQAHQHFARARLRLRTLRRQEGVEAFLRQIEFVAVQDCFPFTGVRFVSFAFVGLPITGRPRTCRQCMSTACCFSSSSGTTASVASWVAAR